jgi:hypothetical protein
MRQQCGDACGSEQQVDRQVMELSREAQQRMRRRYLGQAIGAMLGESAARFFLLQTALRVGRDACDDGRGIQCVPGGRRDHVRFSHEWAPNRRNRDSTRRGCGAAKRHLQPSTPQ